MTQMEIRSAAHTFRTTESPGFIQTTHIGIRMILQS
jgi:hypothetical protein